MFARLTCELTDVLCVVKRQMYMYAAVTIVNYTGILSTFCYWRTR